MQWTFKAARPVTPAQCSPCTPGDGCAGLMGFVRADLRGTLIGIQFPCNFFPLQLQLLWPWTINFWHFRQNVSGDRALKRYFSKEHICHYTISCIINSLNNHISPGSDRRTSAARVTWCEMYTQEHLLHHRNCHCCDPTSSTGKFVPLQNNWPEARDLFMAWCALLRCQLLINWLQGGLIFFNAWTVLEPVTQLVLALPPTIYRIPKQII